MKHIYVVLRSLTFTCMAGSCFFAARPARAQITEIPNQANPAMGAYNSGFLVKANGRTFYTHGYQQDTVSDVEGVGLETRIFMCLKIGTNTRTI